jgi:CRISPR-associated protein Csx16
VCARGARYVHLALELPAARRGSELSADELRELGATLIEYRIDTAQG